MAGLAALLLTVGIAVASQPARSDSAGRSVSARGGPLFTASTAVRTIPLAFGGLNRSYLLAPALDLPAGQPSALLVVLHQDEARVEVVAGALGFQELRHHGVTVVYPSGFGGTWNAGLCCGVARRAGVDDVGFVSAVIADVGRHRPVDPHRRAILGYSGGAMLLYRILCSPHPDLVAAVDVNGSLEAPCPAGVAVPDLLALHGERDGTIGLSQQGLVTHLKMAPRPVLSTLSMITTSAGCGPRTSWEAQGAQRLRWVSCRGGSSVDVVLVHGAGHRWEDVGGFGRTYTWLLTRLHAT